jgi:2-polyprenyl-3-methyl-5-hydroxy-6-metoxy-1,4-benzoquinol methylase
MKVEQKSHTVTIKDTQGDFTSFLMKVTHQYKTFEKHNIIIDLFQHQELSISEIKLFMPLSKLHKNIKKSFVIVASAIDYNAVPNSISVVPSLLEARDLIELEEIERDLGF